MAFEPKAEPVERFENILLDKGFRHTHPGQIGDNTFLRERDFYDADDNEGYVFDFAIYGRDLHNFYVELNSPDHDQDLRKARDERKLHAATKRNIPVLTLTYNEMEKMSDLDIWERLKVFLSPGK